MDSLHHAKSYTPLRRLAALLVLWGAAGCTTAPDTAGDFTRDGQTYGVTEGSFRGRWWNYYERGRSFLDGGFYAEAERDLRAALAARDRDQRWARTYGLHFVPEYFPNRELGIALYHLGQMEEAEARLEASAGQTESALAAHFLDRIRAERVSKPGADTAPPTIAWQGPEGVVGDSRARIAFAVRDDTFVGAVTVNGAPYRFTGSRAAVDVDTEVALEAGENTVTVEAIDLSGKRATASFPLHVDLDGPALSFDTPLSLPGRVRGTAYDPAGIVGIAIGGQNAKVTGAGDSVEFTLDVPAVDVSTPLRFVAEDALGNRNEGVVPVSSLRTAQFDGRAVPASGLRVAALGGGLEGVWAGGQLAEVRLAAASGNAAPAIAFTNLAEGHRFLMPEIVVGLAIHAGAPITTLAINGRAVEALAPGRREQRISRRIALESMGSNTITAEYRDAAGGSGQVAVTVERAETPLDLAANRLSVALLGNLWEGAAPQLDDEAGFVVQHLTRALYEGARFDLVSRDALPRVLEERELRAVLGETEDQPAPEALAPADLLAVGKVRRSGGAVEIVLQAVSARTSRILGYADVAGRAETVEELRGLVDDLALDFAQEFPKAQGTVVDVRGGGRCYTTLARADRVRADLPCLVFRYGEEIHHPETGALLGRPVDLLASGVLAEVRDQLSVIAIEPAAGAPEVKVSDVAVTK